MTRPIAADTHAILWYLTGAPRLSAIAKAAFDDAVEAPQDIYISAMSMVELVYLTERSRIPLAAGRRLWGQIHESPGRGLAGQLDLHRQIFQPLEAVLDQTG